MTKEGIFHTLGIAALIHQTDEAVRSTAKRLCEHAPGSFRKSLLLPLSKSKDALDVVVEQVLNATDEIVAGSLWFNDSEYEVLVRYQGRLWYDVEELAGYIVEWFLRRGCCIGRVYFTVFNPPNRNFHTSSLDLATLAKDSLIPHVE